jgi:hypothetical protein
MEENGTWPQCGGRGVLGTVKHRCGIVLEAVDTRDSSAHLLALTNLIWIELNSFGAAHSCCAASQHRTSWEEWERIHCMGMAVNSKAVFVGSSLG